VDRASVMTLRSGTVHWPSFDLPGSASDVTRRLPALIGCSLLGLSAVLPWSRRYPFSRHSGLDTARIVLGLHHRIAFLPTRSVAWLWCLVPLAGAVGWALAWLRPAHLGPMLFLCGLVAGVVTGWFGVLLAHRHPANVASGVVVAAVGAFLLIVSGPFLRGRPRSQTDQEVM